MRMSLKVLVAGVVSALAVPAAAEPTRFYNLEGFGSWLDGNPETTAVTEEGEIILASGTRVRYEDTDAAYSSAAALGEDVVVAQVDGKVLAIDRAGKSTELFDAKNQLVTAVATHGSSVFVAVGPPAKIYEVKKGSKPKAYFTPDADFVWDMDTSSDGSLYLATGQPGHVVRVAPGGKSGEVLFKPEQSHLRSILVSSELGVFVGGGERGILYRASPSRPKDFRALFDSGHPEITAIAIHDTFAYVAGVTGAQALAAEQGNEQTTGGKGKGPDVRSQLARVAMDGTAEILAGSNDEAIFDVAVNDKNQVVVSTGATGRDDPRGRLYSIDPVNRQIAMVYQSPSRRITHLVDLSRGALAAVAAGGGRIVHLAGGVAAQGEFITPPFDTVINSQFGMLQIFANMPQGTKVTASVRTGQTAKPDDTWSAWSPEIAAPGNKAPQVQNGRYMQLRLTLHSNGKESPRVNRVRLAYRRQNLRPFVREVVALKKGLALLPVYREESKIKSINLNDKASAEDQRGDSGKNTAPNQARQVPTQGALTVKWVAEDPNGDDLKYDLMVRAGGGDQWRTLEGGLEQPFYTIQSSQLPDGHYHFRVRATDSPSNPEGTAQSDTRESQAVLIDNTPPRIDPLKVEMSGRRVTLRTVVADEVGPLIEAGYSVDGAPFQVMAPDDGVLDGPGESFTLRLGELPPGAHTVVVRVIDEGDNVGFAEQVFNVK